MALIRSAYWERKSPPSRGAWIEIMKCLLIEVLYAVAPLAGGVK